MSAPSDAHEAQLDVVLGLRLTLGSAHVVSGTVVVPWTALAHQAQRFLRQAEVVVPFDVPRAAQPLVQHLDLPYVLWKQKQIVKHSAVGINLVLTGIK